jgi:hypothetical protein
MNETEYERELKKRIRARWPDCFIMKNDAQRTQGVPDLLILFNGKWAMLEVKMSDDSKKEANQDYYVAKFDHMSFASFINPGNEEVVLDLLQSALGLEGATRVP